MSSSINLGFDEVRRVVVPQHHMIENTPSNFLIEISN